MLSPPIPFGAEGADHRSAVDMPVPDQGVLPHAPSTAAKRKVVLSNFLVPSQGEVLGVLARRAYWTARKAERGSRRVSGTHATCGKDLNPVV